MVADGICCVGRCSHDYLARSTARGSFLIWTHHLQDITYNEKFVPHGAPHTETYKGAYSHVRRRLQS